MTAVGFLLLLATVTLANVQECYSQRTTPKQQQRLTVVGPASVVVHPTQKPLQAQSGKLVASVKPSPQRTTTRAVTTTTRRGTTPKTTQLSKTTTTSPHSQKMQSGITTRRNTVQTTTKRRENQEELFNPNIGMARSLLFFDMMFEEIENSTSKQETTTSIPDNVTWVTHTEDNYNDIVTKNGTTTVTEEAANITTVAMETKSVTSVTTETVATDPAIDTTEMTTTTDIMPTAAVTDGESTTPATEGSTRKKLKRRKVTTTTTAAPKRVLKRRKIKVDPNKVDHDKIE